MSSGLHMSVTGICASTNTFTLQASLQGWPDPDRWLTVALHAVRLHPRVARQLQRQRLFLMYSFLPELCPAEAQCTHCLPATDTLLTFQHVQVTPCSQAQSCMPRSP